MSLKNVKIAFHTLGCKVNIYETGVMEQDAAQHGAVLTPFTEKADVYVVNTCSVTNIADRKSRQMLHRAKALNPEAVVVAAGCYAETEDREKLLETGVDLILGNEEKKRIGAVLEAYLEKGVLPVNPDISAVRGYSPEKLPAMTSRTRADVKVQDGCNQFCTYCIIPYARGRIRSKALSDAVREIADLAKTGVREIVLTGIHLSSYGKDFPEGKPDLLDLIRAVHEVEGIRRIRLGSLEPRIITEEFVSALAALPKFCPHFHLSLQSGSATVLKRMNRHYSPEEYAERVAFIRRHFAHPAITTDVIAGFPGETAEEFAETLDFVRRIGFYEMHVFQYSRRKGTPADRMPDQVKEPVKKERSEALIRLRDEMSKAYERSLLGESVELLTEEKSDALGLAEGYTKEYVRAYVPASFGTNRILRGILRENHGKYELEAPVFCEDGAGNNLETSGTL